MGIQIRYGMVGGHMNAFIGEVHRKAIAFDPAHSWWRAASPPMRRRTVRPARPTPWT